jgi:amino acid transporter
MARKSMETLKAESESDHGLHRALGPISLTSLGIGAIIGAGIFVMTGRAAANDAGPAIMLSYAVAGVGCALAAFCYAEFASTAPVAGSAYTYAYATLGELFAWIIGWDLILEYAMSCSTVAADWTQYLNEFLQVIFHWQLPKQICSDPFSSAGAWLNLPAVLILAVVTVILVIGIRESAFSNTILVVLKLSVVLFVIVVGVFFVDSANWTGIPQAERKLPEQLLLNDLVNDQARHEAELFAASRQWASIRYPEKVPLKLMVELTNGMRDELLVPKTDDLEERTEKLKRQTLATYMLDRIKVINAELEKAGVITEAEVKKRNEAAQAKYGKSLPETDEDKARVAAVIAEATRLAPEKATAKWGLLGTIGLNKILAGVDNSIRSPFIPYGFSGLMLGASIVFFAFIGFDSISTHAEEARNPKRDVPIGILTSLFVCTALYMAVAAVITGMEPYPEIDEHTAVASAFRHRAEAGGGNSLLSAAGGLIAAGALAGMTSVLLITFLSQARIFLAMARDRLLPIAIFGAVHPRFKTPYISTILTGIVMCFVAALTPIEDLGNMVNIGTLFAFVVVCAAVWILRVSHPHVERPFKCPWVHIVAPAGMAVNFTMMLFLPVESWLRLVVWLMIGLVIYFSFGYWHSTVGKEMRQKVKFEDSAPPPDVPPSTNITAAVP